MQYVPGDIGICHGVTRARDNITRIPVRVPDQVCIILDINANAVLYHDEAPVVSVWGSISGAMKLFTNMLSPI
jgi:hypothetical protein